MTFPYTVGIPVRGLVPVGRLANGEVTHVEDAPHARKRVFVHFQDGTEMTYSVSSHGDCDYLMLDHHAGDRPGRSATDRRFNTGV